MNVISLVGINATDIKLLKIWFGANDGFNVLEWNDRAFKLPTEQQVFLVSSTHSVAQLNTLAAAANCGYLDLDFVCKYLKISLGFSKTIILKALENQCHVFKYLDDSFSINIPNSYKLNFGEYLGTEKQNTDFIKACINANDRLLIKSAAGTGKTYLVDFYLKIAIECNRLERLIFVVPTAAIAGQTATKLNSLGVSNIVIQGNESKTRRLEMEFSAAAVKICVIDSLCWLRSDLNNSMVVVDECHKIVTDSDYRRKMRISIHYIKQSPKIVFLSATPLLGFCTGLYDMLNFKLLNCITAANNRLRLNTVIHECKDIQKSNLVESFSNTNIPKEKTIILKVDKKALLNGHQKRCDAIGVKMDCIYSGDLERKEQNKNYISLIENDVFAEKLRYLGTTCLMQDGVSIKNDCAIISLDNTHWIDITQLAMRARQNSKTGLNMCVDNYLFQTEKTATKETTFFDAYQTLKNLIDNGQKVLDTFTWENKGFVNREKLENLESDILTKTVFFNEQTNNWELDLVGILSAIHQKDLTNSGYDLNLKRVCRNDARFEIVPSIFVDSLGKICPYFAEYKEKRKADKTAAEHLFLADGEYFVKAAARLSSKKELLDKYKSAPDFNGENIKAYIETNKDALSHPFAKEVARRFLFWDGKKDKDSVFEMCLLPRKIHKVELSRFERLRRAKESKLLSLGEKADINKPEKLERELDSSVKLQFRRKKAYKKKQNLPLYFTAAELSTIINEQVLNLDYKKMFSNAQAVQYFKSMYNVEQTRVTRDKITVYIIH